MQRPANRNQRVSGAISIGFLLLGLFLLPLIAEASDCSMGCCTGSASAALAAPMTGCCESTCDMGAAPETASEPDLALTPAKTFALHLSPAVGATISLNESSRSAIPPESPHQDGSSLYLRNLALLI